MIRAILLHVPARHNELGILNGDEMATSHSCCDLSQTRWSSEGWFSGLRMVVDLHLGSFTPFTNLTLFFQPPPSHCVTQIRLHLLHHRMTLDLPTPKSLTLDRYATTSLLHLRSDLGLQ